MLCDMHFEEKHTIKGLIKFLSYSSGLGILRKQQIYFKNKQY